MLHKESEVLSGLSLGSWRINLKEGFPVVQVTVRRMHEFNPLVVWFLKPLVQFKRREMVHISDVLQLIPPQVHIRKHKPFFPWKLTGQLLK